MGQSHPQNQIPIAPICIVGCAMNGKHKDGEGGQKLGSCWGFKVNIFFFSHSSKCVSALINKFIFKLYYMQIDSFTPMFKIKGVGNSFAKQIYSNT